MSTLLAQRVNLLLWCLLTTVALLMDCSPQMLVTKAGGTILSAK